MRKPATGQIVRHFIAFWLIALAARLWAELSDIYVYQGDYGWFNLRAILSDALVSLVMAYVLSFIRLRFAAYVAYFLWAGICAGNLIHIEFNNANINFADSNQLGEREFITGSILSVDVLLPWAGFFLLAYILFRLSKKIRDISFTGGKVAILGCGALIGSVIFLPISENYWRSYNIIEENVLDYFTRVALSGNTLHKRIVEKEYRRFTELDLKGKPIASSPQTKPNILIVSIEGLSDYNLQKGQMPYLQELAANALYYPNFISPQQYTLQGIYSIVCGDYASFSHKTVYRADNKWYATMNRGPLKPCLPSILAKYGYTSLFFQGSSLEYTNKRKFTHAVGFNRSFAATQLKQEGKKQFMKPTFLGWGMADKIFLPNVADKLIAYDQARDEPWFAFAMTTGTHQPYNITNAYAKDFPTRRFAAYHAADEGLKAMMDKLETAGLLKNTLVIVIGDEAHLNQDRNYKFSPMGANWGLAVIKTPDNVRHTSRDYFMQPDIQTSILDYAGLSHEATNFRSVFRQYDTFRPIMMASSHSRFWITHFAPNEILICKINRTNCRLRHLKGELFDAKLSPSSRFVNTALLSAVANKNDNQIRSKSQKITLVESVPVSGKIVTYTKKRLPNNRVWVRKKVTHMYPIAKARKPAKGLPKAAGTASAIPKIQ